MEPNLNRRVSQRHTRSYDRLGKFVKSKVRRRLRKFHQKCEWNLLVNNVFYETDGLPNQENLRSQLNDIMKKCLGGLVIVDPVEGSINEIAKKKVAQMIKLLGDQMEEIAFTISIKDDTYEVKKATAKEVPQDANRFKERVERSNLKSALKVAFATKHDFVIHFYPHVTRPDGTYFTVYRKGANPNQYYTICI